MTRIGFVFISMFLFFHVDVFATKLIKVTVIDEQFLMVYFKDGEVIYRDDATGPSAFSGHDVAEGDDELLIFGKELNIEIASQAGSWLLSSPDDTGYGTQGKQPVAVHRKAKVNNTDHEWNYRLDHWIFLKLPHPLKQGASYRLEINPDTHTDVTDTRFTHDIFNNISEAVHVNMIGYTPNSPVKSADLYLWMGDGGARDYRSFEGNTIWLYDINTHEKHHVSEVKFWKKSAAEVHGRNLTGSDVWNIDFSGFTKPGAYRLVVEDVGCSREFIISEDVYFQPYKTSLRGYFYMRIGEGGENVTPVPRRPLFIPEKDPKGFTIYITDMHPFQSIWDSIPGDTWDEPHFKPAKESIFWKRRLPGNPTNPNAIGGHSDALDWDRHLAHVSNIYDLLLPYILSNGNLNEDYLDIAESGNSIPDIIDEARNEVDLWLSLRHGEAYAHGLTNPSSEKTIMFQAGTTTMAAWANAANCAMLGDCFRISGHTDLMEYYRTEAIKAFEYANRQKHKQLDDRQDIGNAGMRGRDFKMIAAAFLYNLTGNLRWETIMANESVVKNEKTNIQKDYNRSQIWGTVAYLFSPRERHFPELYEHMKASAIHQALQNHVIHMDKRPSRRTAHNNYWQTSQDLQLVMVAHAIADDMKQKQQFEKAMILEADWGLGRNPSNIVEMTGLGERNIVNCYTTGRNDGTPGLHPGHTPYNNLDPWGGSHNGSNPRWFSDKGYPDWEKGGWPHQEAHFNCRYSWANGEFTPRQTMRGKMALYGYLRSLHTKY